MSSASPKGTRKSGAPGKTKNAMRAKSGCYTCRIRRKKCDERPDKHNRCETCVRLRLECLGFGNKRPDWLRDNRNVVDLRDKIKTHLASAGLIKGQSGIGARSAEREQPVLRLNDDEYSSSSSPSTPTISLDEPNFRTQTSSVRNSPYMPLVHEYSHSDQESSPDSSSPGSISTGSSHTLLPAYAPPLISSNSLVSSPGWTSNHTYELGGPSTFGQFYTQESISFYENFDANTMAMVTPATGAYSLGTSSFPVSMMNDDSALLEHYLDRVVDIQYLLAHRNIRGIINDTVQQDPTAMKAMAVLSSVHRTRSIYRTQGNELSDQRYQNLKWTLQTSAQHGHYSEGDVMAALHLVSAFLFGGGTGEWAMYINIACRLCDSALHTQPFGAADALMRSTDTLRFNVKTTMWFDILGAVSSASPPYFMHVYREIFKPPQVQINGSFPTPPKELSMLAVMGCENHIAWAIAEISALAFWKAHQERSGTLSIPTLYNKCHEIELILDVASQREQLPGFEPHVREAYENRHLTSEIFRSSALVYLHSVVSGAFPHCAEIRKAVQQTIEHLKAVQVPDLNYSARRNRSVVRSVVFSIFICGCLTDDPTQRNFLRQRLAAEQLEYVGNCEEVKKLMEAVWSYRSQDPTGPVPWQAYLQKSGLLLV